MEMKITEVMEDITASQEARASSIAREEALFTHLWLLTPLNS